VVSHDNLADRMVLHRRWIEQRSINFVKKQLNKQVNATSLNRQFYKAHGHTCIGLHKYKSHEKKYTNQLIDTVAEYNDYVFSKLNYDDILCNVSKKDILHLERILSISDELYSIDNMGIFTNAPLSWCENIFALCDMDIYKYFHPDQIFTSDEGHLKPLIQSYQNVEKLVSNEILFIDDSISNLLPVVHNDKWKMFLQNDFYKENLYTHLINSV
jgi:FMN phosphatase YigB (HAD superfamily)